MIEEFLKSIGGLLLALAAVSIFFGISYIAASIAIYLAENITGDVVGQDHLTDVLGIFIGTGLLGVTIFIIVLISD